MIFNSLDEAFDELNGFITFDIDYFIKHFQISLNYTDALPSNINGFTVPLTRTMFVNAQSGDQVFTKYHEFIHCLVDDSVEPLVESSYVSGAKIEHRANVGALAIMIKEYMIHTGLEPNQFNLIQFQQYYGLNSKYLYDAANEAERILGIRIDM